MILIGTKCRLEQTVTQELTAAQIGSGALPVFGTGTVLLPWAAACLLLGQAPRAVALAALYAVISAVHSFLEPKVMAAQAGLPPLAALAAMYAGFRAFGVAGMILLPVALLFVKQLHDQGYVGLWK